MVMWDGTKMHEERGARGILEAEINGCETRKRLVAGERETIKRDSDVTVGGFAVTVRVGDIHSIRKTCGHAGGLR